MGERKMIGNREKALIHIAKAQLRMSERRYREILGNLGVSSSKELDYDGFKELMKRFRVAGFKSIESSEKKSGMHRKWPEDRAPMLGKIEAILTDLKLPWSYADGIAKEMFGTDRLKWCDSEQTYKILQALIMHQKRQKEKLQANREKTWPLSSR